MPVCLDHGYRAKEILQVPWVQGSGFRVQGSGFRVWGLGFRVQGSGFRVRGSGFGVQGSGLWWRLRREYIWGDARRPEGRS